MAVFLSGRLVDRGKGSYVNRSSLLSSAAVFSAVGFSAAAFALLRRLLRHGAVEQAARVSSKEASTGELPVVSDRAIGTPAGSRPGKRDHLPVTPVPPNTVTAMTREPAEPDHSEVGGDAGQLKPSRTWVVDNSSAWDGSPLELVVPPPLRGLRKGNPGASPA